MTVTHPDALRQTKAAGSARGYSTSRMMLSICQIVKRMTTLLELQDEEPGGHPPCLRRRSNRAQRHFEALSVFFHGLIRMYDAYRPAEGVCSLVDGVDPRPAAEAAYAARASSA
jgi:hypothetical protein